MEVITPIDVTHQVLTNLLPLAEIARFHKAMASFTARLASFGVVNGGGQRQVSFFKTKSQTTVNQQVADVAKWQTHRT